MDNLEIVHNLSGWHKSESHAHDPIWYLFQIGKPPVVYNISDTVPLIWRIIHGMAVTKKKLAESRDRMRGHQNTCVSKFQRVSTTCQCRLGLLLASAFWLPAGLLYQVYQRVQFYLENVGLYRCNRNSAISERQSCSLPYRVHEADVNIATCHLAIILTEF